MACFIVVDAATNQIVDVVDDRYNTVPAEAVEITAEQLTLLNQQPDGFSSCDYVAGNIVENIERMNLRNKAAKEIELRQACRATCTSGYISNALGADHTYPTTEQDQSNLNAVCTAAQEKRADTTWTCKFWCQDANGVWSRKVHTADQIITVGLAVQVMISTNQDKYEVLLTQLHDATTDTLAKVEAIVW